MPALLEDALLETYGNQQRFPASQPKKTARHECRAVGWVDGQFFFC
jgi:hypothetical protein